MERKIGEIFEYNGEWYQCVKSPDGSCKHCDMNFGGKCPIPIKECVASARSDLSYVIFKKLEKVGEPFKSSDFDDRIVMLQSYKMLTIPYISGVVCYIHYDTNIIDIEIKQNKEDMEEYRMYDAKEDIPNFDKIVDKCLFGKNKLNLKPFDLEAAKAGKPVCTRDGRKARIICFDRDWNMHIVALVAGPLGEEVRYYLSNGKVAFDKQNDGDLMMLPEKKEGWINVYKKEQNRYVKGIFPSREIALNSISEKSREYIATIKITWEE